jgi:exopolysaccharide production protein ExoY
MSSAVTTRERQPGTVEAPPVDAPDLGAGRNTAVARVHAVTDPRIVHAARQINGREKRVFDVIGAAAALAFVSPMLATAWPLLRLATGRAVFAWSPVVGLHGRQFQRLAFNPALLDEDAAGAARIVNKLLRASGLANTPQLVNVLAGEMSLVGPRPVTRSELDDYLVGRRYYLLVRPGVTGLWALKDRAMLGPGNGRAATDREYLMTWSTKYDLVIILRSLFKGGARTGETGSDRDAAALLSRPARRD